MEMNEIPKTTPLPSLIQTIGAGFNLVANKVHLLVLPVLLDLLLLLGPRVRVFDLLHADLAAAFTQMKASIPTGYLTSFQQAYDLLQQMLEQINLLGALHTFPIGIPSLLAGNTPMAAPIAGIQIHETGSIIAALLLMIGLSLIGLLLGCVYFAIIANDSAEVPTHLSFKAFWKQVLNVLLMCVAIIVALCVLLIPASCALSLFSLVSPLIGQVLSIVVFLAAAWMIIPLFFTPHAIFLKRVSFNKAISESFKLARWSSGPTSFFIVLVVVITQGLNLIWSIPEADSWLMLIGIFGHAFIASGLLAASFILFQKDEEWQSENREFIEWRKNLKASQKIKINTK